MKIKVFGSRLSSATELQVFPPPSKSHSIRFLILAALAKGSSKIDNILISDDISSAYSCFASFGVQFKYENCDGTRQTVHVIPPKEGIFKYAINKKEVFMNVGNSGTLLYMLSILVASIPATFHIEGDASIKQRPLQPIIEALNELNVNYETSHSLATEKGTTYQTYKILTIHGRTIESELNIKLEGQFSQVVSGLLIASSFFHAKTHLSLKIAGEAPYIMMTLKHLKKRGIPIHSNKDLTKYECCTLNSFEGFCEIVPNDWSQACFLALASVASHSPIVIAPLLMEKEQADSNLVNYLKQFGCSIHFENDSLKIEPTNQLKASHFNLFNTPDSLPYLAALCAISNGKSTLENIEICRFKECDRVHAMSIELAKMNVNILEEKNKLTIYGTPHLKHGSTLCTYGDHRIAMSLIALCLSLKEDEWCIIEDAECCKISYPEFIYTLRRLGARIEEI